MHDESRMKMSDDLTFWLYTSQRKGKAPTKEFTEEGCGFTLPSCDTAVARSVVLGV